ncbi:hypothetical protein BC629DRAFT_1504988, partial [Irpex lacteus]
MAVNARGENTRACKLPLRAYDVDGNLIAPGDWMKELQGAYVLVKFTDNYYADIDEIRVLKAPRPTPTSPR